MADLTQVSDANLLAALKARADAKIAEALPHIEALLKILDPEANILQGTAADNASRTVYQACSVFKRSINQMITVSPNPSAPKSSPATPDAS